MRYPDLWSFPDTSCMSDTTLGRSMTIALETLWEWLALTLIALFPGSLGSLFDYDVRSAALLMGRK